MKQATIASILLLLSFGVRAATPDAVFVSDTVDTLATSRTIAVDSIVVTARPLHEIVPAQLISGDELARLPTSSVADALRYFSGMQIKDYGGIGGLKTVNVRSLGSMHTGVFLDGIAVGNAQNGVVDLGRFSLDNIEAVAVYNGQKSDIFQPARDYASASALYMSSRKPVFEPDVRDSTKLRRDNLDLTLKTGSFDLVDGSVLWEHRFGKKRGSTGRDANAQSPDRYPLASSLNIELLNTSGRYRFRQTLNGGRDTTMTRRNGDVRFIRAEAALFGNIRGGEWRVKAYLYNSERGYPGSVINEEGTISIRNEDRQTDRSIFVQGSLNQQISNTYSYKVQAKYANDRTNYLMPETTTGKPSDAHYRQQEAWLSVANLFNITRWLSANLSVDGQFNTLAAHDRRSHIFNEGFPEPSRVTALSAAALSVRLRKFSAQTSALYTYTHETSARGMATADDRHILTPTAIVSYRPFNRVELDFRAFYKHIFRLPTFNDLYYTQLGNRNLRPERTTQYNLGTSYGKTFAKGFLAAITASVDGYFNSVRDKIIATPAGNQLIWTMVNVGYVEIIGVDVALAPRFRIGRGRAETLITTRLNYTYQSARDLSDSRRPRPYDGPGVRRGFGDQIPYTPWHSGSAVLGVRWRDLDFNYSFIYTGQRYSSDNTPKNHIPPWYTHDLSASYNFRFPYASLRLTGEVNNIFDRPYEVVTGYPMPGINFKIILSLTI